MTILRPDDLEVGMLVTALHGPMRYRSNDDFLGGVGQVVAEENKGYNGTVWVVKEIMLPYIVVEEWPRKFIGPRPIDIREFQLMKVTPEFAAALNK